MNIKEDEGRPLKSIFNDSKSSILKADMPIGRKKYFTNALIIGTGIALVILTTMILEEINIPAATQIVLFISSAFLLCLLYLQILNDSKRLWDILGLKKTGIILAILIQILNLIFVYLKAGYIPFIIFILLILIPGKLIKKEYEK